MSVGESERPNLGRAVSCPPSPQESFEQSGVNLAVVNEEEKRCKAPALVPSELPILSALFGARRVREWCGAFLSDEEPIEDGQSVD